jgi:hypothetical protein
VHLKLIECGSKLPAALSIAPLALGQAKPAGSGPRDARRHALPLCAAQVFLIFERCL